MTKKVKTDYISPLRTLTPEDPETTWGVSYLIQPHWVSLITYTAMPFKKKRSFARLLPSIQERDWVRSERPWLFFLAQSTLLAVEEALAHPYLAFYHDPEESVMLALRFLLLLISSDAQWTGRSSSLRRLLRFWSYVLWRRWIARSFFSCRSKRYYLDSSRSHLDS